MVAFADLVKTVSKDAFVSRLVGFIRMAGFPALSWQETTFPRFTIESESSLLAEVTETIAAIAKGGFVRFAKGPWLDLVAENVFSDARKPATNTVGEVLLTDSAGVGPVSITVGQKWFANGSKTLRYVVTSTPYGASLPLNGTLRVVVRAELAGSAYNVGTGAITELVTSTPGVTVSNPAIGDTGTWITAQGVDEELDEALASRMLDKWSLLGTGSTDGAYRYRVLSSSPEVTRARVWSPGGGSVRIVVAGPSVAVSPAALALATTSITTTRPLGVPDVTVANCGVLSLPITATLVLAKGQDPATRIAAAQAACDAYARTHPIGSLVSRERIIRDLFVDGCTDLDLSSPAADVVLADGEIYVPSYTLTATVAA